MLSRVKESDKVELIEMYQDLVFDKHFQYISSLNMNGCFLADPNNKNQVEFISKTGDKINGYFFANIDSNNPKIAHISNCFSFHKKTNPVFSRDLREFVLLLKEYGINKLEWAVWDGNPAKDLYDKIAGVRYVGYFTNGAVHRGKEVDIYMYELFI